MGRGSLWEERSYTPVTHLLLWCHEMTRYFQCGLDLSSDAGDRFSPLSHSRGKKLFIYVSERNVFVLPRRSCLLFIQ